MEKKKAVKRSTPAARVTARINRMKWMFYDHDCVQCERMNTMLLELIHELRLHLSPNYGMLVTLAAAEAFLRIAGKEAGKSLDEVRAALVVLSCETAADMPYPPVPLPGDFPKAGPRKEPWDGREAVHNTCDFLVKAYSVTSQEGAIICARAARAFGVFVRNPESVYLQAFGEELLMSFDARNADTGVRVAYVQDRNPDRTLN